MSSVSLEALRGAVRAVTSEKRFAHTLRVEAEVLALGELFSLSEQERDELQIAAILHDFTKELSLADQVALCERFGIPYTRADCLTPKVFHARTGAALARERFCDLITDRIYRAIERHTVAAPDLTVFEALLYLADYIEAGRTFGDCVRLRQYFYDGIEQGKALYPHLDDTLLLSLDMTVADLLGEGAIINEQTLAARNALLLRRADRRQL